MFTDGAVRQLLLQISYNNKCIGDDTKAAARQSSICIKKQ